MTLAKLRWTIKGRTLTLADGTTWKLSRRTPKNVQAELARFPHEYIQLGHAAADLKEDVRMAKRRADTAWGEVDGWKMKYNNIKGLDIESLDKVVAILSDDLEVACNLLIRISVALGIQPGGEFFHKIQTLVEKYGMKMHYAKSYTARGTVAEAIDAGPASVKIGEDGKVHVVPELPPGEYDIPGTDDDPFDYHLSIRKDENPDGVLLPNLLDDES